MQLIIMNSFIPGGLFCPYNVVESICQEKGIWFSLFFIFILISPMLPHSEPVKFMCSLFIGCIQCQVSALSRDVDFSDNEIKKMPMISAMPESRYERWY